MKLLIATQALDRDHPVLGFFHRWVEEFAKHAESVTVIASFVGDYDLPPNVTVHSLGKPSYTKASEGAGSRLMRAVRFIALICHLQRDYDAVFVHMIPEFVIAGAVPWRLMDKRVGLWYVHGTVSWRLKLAAFFSDFIVTASPESCRIKSKKVHVLGHGIDTNFFTPDPSIPRTDALLSVGRLDASKRHDLAIHAAADMCRALRIAGEGPERGNLEKLAKDLGTSVTFLGGLAQPELRDEYRRASALIHTSETGSLDKVVLEALATDTPVKTSSAVYKDFPMGAGGRVSFIREHHSLEKLIPRVLSLYVRD